jgi:methylenetetrahydrofolate--tRNA-(uracil-5-)-methyltransferase
VKYYQGNADVIIVGGGLAGCEAAWQAATRGLRVKVYEMRPGASTGAHQSPYLAELVCSNSLGSNLEDRAGGVLKNELRALGSLLIRIADESAVPAGGALAVDRELFAQRVTAEIEGHPNIVVQREEITEVPDGPTIIASGPLTSTKLCAAITQLTGQEQIYFFDALAPIIIRESINMDIAYQASRYGNESSDGGGDYINCPMDKDEYYQFVEALVEAECIQLRDFEQEISSGVKAGPDKYFEGCLPVEVIAKRSKEALAFGPMRPVGLTDPRTGGKAYAILQLRQDNLARTLYNLVGFQTNLTYQEQKRVFQMVPGLERAEFARYGQMHRNTFIFSPALIDATLQYRFREDLFFAGQITGVEGYVGNIASGLLAGWNAANLVRGTALIELPPGTLIGGLCNYISHAERRDFQPMKANFGILPELDGNPRGKRIRGAAHAARSKEQIREILEGKSLNIPRNAHSHYE